VLEPGVYRGGAAFVGQSATIAGNNATLDVVDAIASTVLVDSASSINIRDLNIEEHLVRSDSDHIAVIQLDDSELTMDRVHSELSTLYAVSGNSVKVVIRNSEFAGGTTGPWCPW